MDLYLITGFLGAGKTTFLRNFIRMFQGKKIRLIINEFGRVAVDGALLKELDAQLAEIGNGSIFCACRFDRFEEELETALRDGPDVVLVEASGLSDPTNISKVFSSEKFSGIEYQGSICLVDAVRLRSVLSTARVCPRQLMVSSVVLVNKTDLVSQEEKEEVIQMVREVNPAASIHTVSFGHFDPSWLGEIRPRPALEEGSDLPDLTLQKYTVEISPEGTIEQLRRFLAMVCEDSYRIKGIVRLEGRKYLVDYVGPLASLVPYEGEENGQINRLTLLAGAKMPLRKSLRQAISWYEGFAKEIRE